MSTVCRMRWLRSAWRIRDWLISGGLTAGLILELVLHGDADLARSLPLAIAAGVALFWRRTQPIPAFIATWLCLFGLAIVVRDFDNVSTTFVIAYFVSLFSLGAHTRGREVAASVLLVLIGIATFGLTDSDSFSAGDIAFATFFVGGPWATGLALRLRGELAESNARLKLEQEEATRRAVAEERATIARELHDVVAHAISSRCSSPEGRGAFSAATRRRSEQRWTPSSTPTPRPSATCAGCSRCCGTPRATRRRPRSRRSPGSTTSLRTSGDPA